MKITPQVVAKDLNVTYTLGIGNNNNLKNIESLEVFSKTDYFHNEKVNYTIDNNLVKFDFTMPHLGEFVLKVNFTYKESKFVFLYCVSKSLIKLRPFKGDMHMHSYYSDGKRTPFAMSLASLEAGMDFMSITDHDNYKGSIEAIAKIEEHDIDLLVFPGEEVSVGRGDIMQAQGNGHILSINANTSIENQRLNTEEHTEELKAIAKTLKNKDLYEGLDPLHYAKNIWAIKKIHDAGGIAILCHPHWIYKDHKYHLHQPIFKQMIKDSQIDGIEVLGDIDKLEECNNLTYLTFLQNKNAHKNLSPIANSDAHDSDHDLGLRFSIIFAHEKTKESIAQAIITNKSVAVLKRDETEHQLIGAEKLSDYVFFLLKEYYPRHQKLKYRISRLHLDSLINNFDFSKQIKATRKKFELYNQSFFMKA